MSLIYKSFNFKKISTFSVLAVLLVCLVIFFAIWNSKTRLKVLFIDIPEPVQNSLTAQVSQLSKRKPVFKTFKGDLTSLKKSVKKSDIVFSYNGNAAEEVGNFAKEIPNSILQTVPENFLNGKRNSYPILLDHYGIFYYDKVRQAASIQYATGFSEFESYLKKVKTYAEIPLFVSGGRDSNLLAFVGAVIEGVFGSDSYLTFVDSLKNYKNMEDFLKIELSSGKTVKDAFDIILDFERKGYLHSAWLGAMPEELKNYTLDSRFAIAFTSLLNFRTLGSVLGQGFSMDRMPVLHTNLNHGLIAPAIQIFCTSDKKIAWQTVFAFSGIDVQNNISDTTMLALASAFAASYDKQADDVRFLAASCSAGPLCEPLVAAFELDEKRGKSFCKDLRSYFKNFY
ncbi:hypothetical protein [Treponema pectinovorum]|uniref:hypothetical protein n=1 Tax=Treponema pectinovorum TaxID=164 RepID=UPI0011C79106|nr:hypothetical protein [Treponema pectinovorum]